MTTVRTAISGAESASGEARKSALNTLAGSLAADAKGSKDPNKVGALVKSLNDLATISR